MSIKGYPYDNKDLVTITLDWIKELAKTNLNWMYSKNTYNYDSYKPTIFCKENNENYTFNFYTNHMYNDFHDKHICYLGLNQNSPILHLNYSGNSQCMVCGDSEVTISDPAHLECTECNGLIYCDHCEQWFNEDEIIYENDVAYCSYCYYEYYTHCNECGNLEANNWIHAIFLASEDCEIIESVDVIFLCSDCFDKFINNYHVIKNHDMFLVKINEIDEKLKRKFDVFD